MYSEKKYFLFPSVYKGFCLFFAPYSHSAALVQSYLYAIGLNFSLRSNNIACIKVKAVEFSKDCFLSALVASAGCWLSPIYLLLPSKVFAACRRPMLLYKG
jgi:hypothetical protein